jgi:hypothetical protein
MQFETQEYRRIKADAITAINNHDLKAFALSFVAGLNPEVDDPFFKKILIRRRNVCGIEAYQSELNLLEYVAALNRFRILEFLILAILARRKAAGHGQTEVSKKKDFSLIELSLNSRERATLPGTIAILVYYGVNVDTKFRFKVKRFANGRYSSNYLRHFPLLVALQDDLKNEDTRYTLTNMLISHGLKPCTGELAVAMFVDQRLRNAALFLFSQQLIDLTKDPILEGKRCFFASLFANNTNLVKQTMLILKNSLLVIDIKNIKDSNLTIRGYVLNRVTTFLRKLRQFPNAFFTNGTTQKHYIQSLHELAKNDGNEVLTEVACLLLSKLNFDYFQLLTANRRIPFMHSSLFFRVKNCNYSIDHEIASVRCEALYSALDN